MIQEQISNFIEVKSFERRYPDIRRQLVDSEERTYLLNSGLVSETSCDLAWANGLSDELLMADGSKQGMKKDAMESASNWNSTFNRSRREDRRSAIDLQTFIIHYPKSRTQNMITLTPRLGSYPISILPGQFCDYYEYSSTVLPYMPVSTVVYGPVRHLLAAKDADSSFSDDSSCTTSKGTQATEDILENMDKDTSIGHLTCLDLSLNMVPLIKSYKWQCPDCKNCACCKEYANEDEMLFCDICDRGYHKYCVGLKIVPSGSWQCQECTAQLSHKNTISALSINSSIPIKIES